MHIFRVQRVSQRPEPTLFHGFSRLQLKSLNPSISVLSSSRFCQQIDLVKMGNSAGKAAHEYVEKEHLGKGTYGEVKLVHMKDNPTELFALKRIPYGGLFSATTKDMIAHEIAIQQKFDHSNITKLVDFWYEPGKLYGGTGYILLEYCAGQSTRKYGPHGSISAVDFGKHVMLSWEFIEQMIDALVYVHNKDIIHRDLKLDNILIHEDGRFMLTDFGISTGLHEELQKLHKGAQDPAVFNETHLRDKETLRTHSTCGTILYMAPEIFSEGSYGKAVDLYALGLALREMLAQQSVATFPDFSVERLVYQSKPIVPAASELPLLFLCAAPLVHRNMYAVLAVHTVLFLLSSLTLRYLIMLRIANCMTSRDPADRLTIEVHAQYMTCSKVIVERVYPVICGIVVALYPFDAYGNTRARRLVDCIFALHVAFSLVWYPSLAAMMYKFLKDAVFI